MVFNMAKVKCSSCGVPFEDEWMHFVCGDCNRKIGVCCIGKHKLEEEPLPCNARRISSKVWIDSEGNEHWISTNYLCGKCGKPFQEAGYD